MDTPRLRFMRDPTRGGIATIAHEIAQATHNAVRFYENKIPVNDQGRTVAEMLGYDPLYMAFEGQVLAVIDAAYAKTAIQNLNKQGYLVAAIIVSYRNGSCIRSH
jgi:hydrogenase expression/formation protein HypE